MRSFEELFSAHTWIPIRGCPGRFVLRGGPSRLAPRELVGEGFELRESRVQETPDAVIAAPIENGGLISFRKGDGTYIHTLNTVAGFERKLRRLGLYDHESGGSHA